MKRQRGAQLARTIETDADLREGVRALRRKCPHLRRVHERTGDPPLRRHAPGFEGLARIIVGQQLSIASAEAIWARVVLAVRPMTPRRLPHARRRGAAPRRPVARKGAHAARRQRGDRGRARSGDARARARGGRARGLDRRAGHRPVVGRHFPVVLPRARRCLCRRRPRAADGGNERPRPQGAPLPRGASCPLPNGGGRGAAWPRTCCGPTTSLPPSVARTRKSA